MSLEEREEQIEATIKPFDSWWTTVFPAKAANRLVRAIIDTPITPNQITVLSLVIGISSGALFVVGCWPAFLAGAILLQIAFILDCADGQLARSRGEMSRAGGWLDTATDIFKNFSIFLGLTWGSARSGSSPDIWIWGFFAYFLSVSSMFLYAIRPPHLRADEPLSPGEPYGAVEAVYRFIRRRAYFLSFSIPDQLLLISIGAALNQPRLTIIILTIWGAPALCFSLLRTWLRLVREDKEGNGRNGEPPP